MSGLHCRTTPNGRQTVILHEEAGLDFRIEPRARHRHSLDDFPNLKRRFTAIAARRACDLAQTINNTPTVSATRGRTRSARGQGGPDA